MERMALAGCADLRIAERSPQGGPEWTSPLAPLEMFNMAFVEWRERLLWRGGSGPRAAAFFLLLLCVLFSPVTHTHPIFDVGIGVDYGVASKPCPACVSESSPGLTPDSPSVLPALEVLGVVVVPAIADLTTAVVSATGRSPPCA